MMSRVSAVLYGVQRMLYLLWRLCAQLCHRYVGRPLSRLARRGTEHDQRWRAHPAVETGEQLTFGERAADVMKGVFATWRALLGILLFMACWLASGGFGHDPAPFILLNLCLSCLAALQCFILLIAAKRADQIAATVALHTLDNTQDLKTLIEQNTALTEQVATLTRAVHEHLTATPQQSTPTLTPSTRKLRASAAREVSAR